MKTKKRIVGTKCVPDLRLMRVIITSDHLKISYRILVCGLMFTFLFSCANQDNIVLRYKMEKELFKSEKLRQVLFINLKVASPMDFKRVIDSYQDVVNLASRVKPPLEHEISNLAASAQLRISELYFLKNDLDSSILSFHQVLKSYPQSISQNKKALLGLGKIYERRYQKEKAVQIYHQLLDNYNPFSNRKIPDPEILELPTHLIQLYSLQEEKSKREQEFEYAKGYYQNLVNSYPNTQISFTAILGLARSYQLQRMWKESIQTLEIAKDTSGQIPGALLLQIGDIYYDELKDEKNAFTSFIRVINSSTDTLSKAEAQMKIGMIYFQKGDYTTAKTELSKVNRFYPTATYLISTSQYLIAQIYEKRGEWERALNEYNWLMINNPLTPEGLDAPLRVVSYYQKVNQELVKESVEEAEEHYDELLNKYKDKPFILLIEKQKAKLYHLHKDWDKAISSWQKISEKYPRTEAGLSALINIWRIYKLELKDVSKSKVISAQIESGYPEVILDTLMNK